MYTHTHTQVPSDLCVSVCACILTLFIIGCYFVDIMRVIMDGIGCIDWFERPLWWHGFVCVCRIVVYGYGLLLFVVVFTLLYTELWCSVDNR